MDSLTDLTIKLGHAIIALGLIITTLNLPKGPPSSPSAQLAYPFEAARKDNRGHPYLRKAAAKYIKLATGTEVAYEQEWVEPAYLECGHSSAYYDEAAVVGDPSPTIGFHMPQPRKRCEVSAQAVHAQGVGE